MLEIREPTEDNRPEIAQVAGLSFNFALTPEAVTLAGALCAFDGARVVGTARAIPMGQWFGGSLVPCAGVAGVTVLPEYRGRGLAGAMVRQLLQDRRSQGDTISTLYPANSALYRQLGYEYGGLCPEFRVYVEDLPADRSEVRQLAEGEVPDAMACFSRYAASHNGPVETADPVRFTTAVLAHKGEGTFQRTVVVPGEHGLDGYASYFLGNWETEGYCVQCKHLVALTSSALKALLGHLRRFENAAREVSWRGAPSANPIGSVLPSSGFSVTPRLRRWMLRVLDVPRALELRGYPSVEAEVVIGTEDPLFPENNGPWLLQVSGGRARVSPAPGGAPRPVPVGMLSSLYTGIASPTDLVVVGAMEVDDPRLGALSTIFRGPEPWMADFF